MNSSHPADFDLTTLIDTSLSDAPFQQWLEFCEEKPAATERDAEPGGSYCLKFPHTGASLLLDASDLIKTIHIYVQPRDGFSAYQPQLPFGGNASTSREEAIGLFYEPSFSGGPTQALPDSPIIYWDRWDFDTHSFHFEYPEDRLSLSLVTIMSPSVLPEPPADESESLDPNAIYFSLATLNDALPATHGAATEERDFLIHEDDWRQFEAVSRDFTPEIDQELDAIHHIHAKKCEISGTHRLYTECHVRKLIPRPLGNFLRWSELLTANAVSPKAVAGLGFRDSGQQIWGGFSFQIAELTFFGVHHGELVETLCFSVPRFPCFNEAQAQILAHFLERKNLILLYWPNAYVLGGPNTIAEYLQRKD